MSRYYTIKEKKIDVEFRPSSQATAHGGQMAVSGIIAAYCLWDKLKEYPELDPRTDTTS